jgi:two-component system, NarL family, response regulator LiaR
MPVHQNGHRIERCASNNLRAQTGRRACTLNQSEKHRMPSIRVFVVDDYPMIRKGLAAMLAHDSGMHWLGEASDGAEALRLAPALAPHVVLVDLDMPQLDGVATIAALRVRVPDARCLLLMSEPDASSAKRALDAGASGYLLKSAEPTELFAAIRAAHQGHTVAPGASAEGDAADSPAAKLTQRERELLGLMARGLSNQNIADQLSIAMPTVKFHVTNILTKMAADNRTEAVLTALRHKIVTLD